METEMKIVNDEGFFEACKQAKEGIIERMLKTINLDVFWTNDKHTTYAADQQYSQKYANGFKKLLTDFINANCTNISGNTEGYTVSHRTLEMARTSVDSLANNMRIDIINTTLSAMSDIVNLRRMIHNQRELKAVIEDSSLTRDIDEHLKDVHLTRVGRRILGIGKCVIAVIYTNVFKVGLVNHPYNQTLLKQRDHYNHVIQAYKNQCMDAYTKAEELYNTYFKSDLDILLEQDKYYMNLGKYTPEYKKCLEVLNIGNKTPLADKIQARCAYRTLLERRNKELCSQGIYDNRLDEVNAQIDEVDTWLDLINEYHDIGEVRNDYYRNVRPKLLAKVDDVYNTYANYEGLLDIVQKQPYDEALKQLQRYRMEFDSTTIGNYTLKYVENILDLAESVMRQAKKAKRVKEVDEVKEVKEVDEVEVEEEVKVDVTLPDNIVRIYEALMLPPSKVYNDVELEVAKDKILNAMPIPLDHENLIKQGKLTDYMYVACLFMLETHPELWRNDDGVEAEQMALWIREHGYEWKVDNI